MAFDEKLRERIIATLRARGAIRPCPRCGHEQFSIAEGYARVVLSKHISEEVAMVMKDDSLIVSFFVICTNCGYMAEHALAALGLGET